MMFELFVMGGPLFMGLITLTFLIALIVATVNAFAIFGGGEEAAKGLLRLSYVKSIGLLALVLGVLGQMIGLYSAFEAIQEMGSVSPAMLAGGLKVSSITTIWGLICYVLCLLVYLGLSAVAKKQ
ncbi:MotA/TolQ/ExbB proton channel family protein [Marinoscillum furvescens]|nr:MotA/TolQ/ExbB proton channel family protein [Marinoscillum furvescens]